VEQNVLSAIGGAAVSASSSRRMIPVHLSFSPSVTGLSAAKAGPFAGPAIVRQAVSFSNDNAIQTGNFNLLRVDFSPTDVLQSISPNSGGFPVDAIADGVTLFENIAGVDALANEFHGPSGWFRYSLVNSGAGPEFDLRLALPIPYESFFVKAYTQNDGVAPIQRDVIIVLELP
jgi:hypothetical protein